MPMAGSLWDMRALKAVVADWYGLPPHQMPMVVKTREEELDDFEADHPELAPMLWEFVNHPVRQTMLWARRDDVDIVVWSSQSQSFKLVQDIRFKDAYPDEASWRQAILEVVKDKEMKVWIVFHV
jgi:hypothetical protein